MTEPAPDPCTQYARDVVAGRVVAGRLVRLACARHLRDLDEGPARGLRWDVAAADHALRFFGWLCLSEGEHDGKPFTLQPFQAFIVGSLFGWKGEDGFRRFRTAYVEMGKGNGKSPLAAGIGLYCLVADGEAGAEVYSAATTREQASILFRDARHMALGSPALESRLKVDVANILHARSRSFFRPVSSEHKGLDGKRVHAALVDELHEHPTALVVDKMRAGTKGRRQALIFEITNSGWDRKSVCWQHHDFSAQVLEGTQSNDSWFAYVCCLDVCAEHRGEGKDQPVEGCEQCDDWRDEATWPKANPCLGVSITLKYLREQVAEAEGMPTKAGIVRRLNFCVWTEGATRMIPAELWALGAGKVDRAVLQGRRCYGGMDLASRYDLAAVVLAFPAEDGSLDLLPFFWIPEACADEREKRDRVPYRLWREQGFVFFTPGEVTDYPRIEDFIKGLAGEFQLEELAYDPFDATQMSIGLQAHGLKLIEFRQNMFNFHEPTEAFLTLLKEGKLRHGGHPVLSWNASNTVGLTDRANHIRPVKPPREDGKKIDGITAAVMSVARATLAPPETTGGFELW